MGAEHEPVALPPRTRAFWTIVVAAAILIGVGVTCFVRQTQHGFITTGLRNIGYGGAAWGLYIGFDVFFTGVSFAGITVAAIARLFDVEALKPVTRLAELITIASLLAGACTIVSDLGRPLHGLLNLPRVADPQSPFFGTFTLVVAGYMFSSAVFFFLSGRSDAARLAADPTRHVRWPYRLWASGYGDSPGEQRRHRRTSFWLSLGILPLLITAHSTLGLIFGIQSGRPGWYSALQAPAFVVMAGVSGTGVVILAAIAMRQLFGAAVPDESLRWLGNFLWVLSLVYLYFMIVDEVTAGYAGPAADRTVAHEVVAGRFGALFWTIVGSLVTTVGIGFTLYLRRRVSVFWVGVAALSANVAAVLKRVVIVVPSQTAGALVPIEEGGGYAPTWIEYGIIAGLLAMITLVVVTFATIFPIVPVAHPSPPRGGSRARASRSIATAGTIAAAVAFMGVGLFDSFRQLRPGELDPRIPYSPVLFAVGVMTLFGSAVVYELVARDEPGDAPGAPLSGGR